MTNASGSATARTAAPSSRLHRSLSRRPPAASPSTSNADVASTPKSCAPPWRPPSAPPMPPAHGTGKPPTTPARRRRSCSCANTARRFSAKPRLRPPRCRCWRRSRAFSPPTHAARTRARRSNSSRRRFRSASRRAPPPPSRRLIGCSSLRPAPGCSPFSPRVAGGSLVLNELAEARAALLDQLFPGVTVTRFDARRSTIISMPPSRRAWF